MIPFLSYPITRLTWKEVAGLAVGIGLFVVLFILVFSPFDFHLFNLKEKIELALIIACMVIFSEGLVLGFIKWITDQYDTKLVVWHHLVAGLSIILLCSQLIYSYTIETGWNSFSFQGSLIYFGSTAAIAFFPLSAGLILRIKKSPTENAHLKVADGNLVRNIPLDSIITVKAFDNYLKIFWLENSGTPHLSIIRWTLSEMETYLKKHHNFIRCHRSYIVNLEKIMGGKGNSTRFSLLLKDYDSSVPVSRDLIPKIRSFTGI